MDECPDCGMLVDPGRPVCPKCDAPLVAEPASRGRRKHRGKRGRNYHEHHEVFERDIAHSGETVDEAMRKLIVAVDDAIELGEEVLRLVVGHGEIGEEARMRLGQLRREGMISEWRNDGANTGALIVEL